MQCRVISCRHTVRLSSSTIVLCNVAIYAMVIDWATIRLVHNTIKIYFHMHLSVNETAATRFGCCKPFVKILVLFEPSILVSLNTVSLPPYEFTVVTQHDVFSKVAAKYIFDMPNSFVFIFEISKCLLGLFRLRN